MSKTDRLKKKLIRLYVKKALLDKKVKDTKFLLEFYTALEDDHIEWKENK